MCMGTVCQFCGQRVAAVVATAAAISVSVLWTACLRCGGHSHSNECVSSADSVSPLWWPQPQRCDRSVPLSCALKMHRKDGILGIFHHKRKIMI